MCFAVAEKVKILYINQIDAYMDRGITLSRALVQFIKWCVNSESCK